MARPKKPKHSADRSAALDEAATSAERGDFAACVESLIAAWEGGPHGELVPLLWAALARSGAVGVTADRERDVEARWLTLLERHTTHALTQVALTPWPRLPRFAVARVRALVAGPPHVLVTVALWRLVSVDPYESEQGDKAIRAGLRALFAWKDPAASALLELTVRRHRHGATVAYGDLQRRRATPPKPLTDVERDALARLTKNLGSAPAADLGELEAAVYRAPTDLSARAVYADALSERGDPRGEFITLQLSAEQRALNAAQKRRELALVREHGRDWLGALLPFVDRKAAVTPHLFRAGFPARVRLVPRVLEGVFDNTEAWATVEALTLRHEPLQYHPNLRGLREVVGATRLLPSTRGASFPHLDHLAMHGEIADVADSLTVTAGVRSFELLFVDDSPLAAVSRVITRLPWRDTLRHLSTWARTTELAQAPSVLAALPLLERLTVHLDDVSVEAVVFSRSAPVTLVVVPNGPELEPALAAIVTAAKLTTVRVESSESFSSRDRQAAVAQVEPLLQALGVAIEP